jgi:hypothetical protein
MPQHLTANLALTKGDTKEVTFTYTTELGETTIDTSTWSVSSGLSVAFSSNTTTTTTAFVSTTSAAVGTYYEVENQIVTSGGQTLQRRVVVVIAHS